jgi:hypothetical protein
MTEAEMQEMIGQLTPNDKLMLQMLGENPGISRSDLIAMFKGELMRAGGDAEVAMKNRAN